MPANWPVFIQSLATEISSQNYTEPGGAGISYPKPEFVSKVGNPANAALKSNPADYTNAMNANPLSGRYDFGVKVAELYISAVKNFASTHVLATHANNPAAETILKQGYGIAFERLLKEGDIPLMDQKDEDGNVLEAGKESHPAYADLCLTEEELTPPTKEELDKEDAKLFETFLEEEKANLQRFTHFEFPCLSGDETLDDLKQLIATRLLMRYSRLQNPDKRWRFFEWVDHLGDKHYKDLGNGAAYWYYGSTTFPNVNSTARDDIENAGYNWQELVNSVSGAVTYWITESHPKQSESDTIEDRVRRPRTKEIQYPPKGRDLCELNEYKLQVSFDRENDLPDNPSKRPRVLTDHVVALFSWKDGYRENPYLNSSSYPPRFKKNNNWVKSNYEVAEWDQWRKIPSEVENAEGAEDIIEIDPNKGGTKFRFEQWKVKKAYDNACACEEAACDVDHPWEEEGETPDGKKYKGDPYMMMARVTIAYWYACIVQPFKSMPAAPPAIISPPLGGIYVPVYYGSANRLANNLRRAWNTGKSFSQLPATQPPALATSTAVAGAYALHLLEFKLLYLGGIPTPFGPVPMVGFVPVVF